jgi:hypothetical protein
MDLRRAHSLGLPGGKRFPIHLEGVHTGRAPGGKRLTHSIPYGAPHHGSRATPEVFFNY